MKRKVIQIAESTQLVSLPRQWAKAHNIKRGDEIDVQEDGNRVIISAESAPTVDSAELNISKLGAMIPRSVSAMYKRGVDSLKLDYDNPELVQMVHAALAKDTVSFEILEQGDKSCVIKHVAGNPTEFESVLRRVFLLLNTMSEECNTAFRKENYALLNNLAFLEDANNRFTTACMRYLNKIGVPEGFNKVGPLYHLVEELEQLADQYKYICQHYSKLEKTKVRLRKEVLDLFEGANKAVKVYSEVFYKLDNEKLVSLRETRNDTLEDAHVLMNKNLNYAEYWLIYHSITIAQRVFAMVDSLLVLKL
jgi:phosphate uptake regulator